MTDDPTRPRDASARDDGPGTDPEGPRRAAALLRRINDRAVRVGIIGLGYVGLPLARAFADNGIAVLGFDVDPEKVAALHDGRSYIGHITDETIRRMVAAGFEATDRFERLDEPDAIIICVPTPLTDAREPDLRFVVASVEAVAARLRPGQLVVLESTTYPGTTRQVVLPILEAGGLRAGVDVFLAFSPEREDPGNPDFSAPTIPKVVGGLEPLSLELAASLYALVVVRVVPVSSPEVAEASKILENTYRAVNIALVNELKMLYDRMGVNVWEVIDAARTKPFGFQAFYPGPGLGGHCLAGSETARIRGQGLDTVIPLADLFERSRGRREALNPGGLEVVEPVGLETLSIDTATGQASWRTVSHLFRRRFHGAMLTIQLAGNRALRVTDRHPMLVVAEDQIEVREARDLKPGDRVPLFNGLVHEAGPEDDDPRVDQVLAGLLRGDGGVNVHIGARAHHKKGRSYHHEFNSGQVGYFSSSPELLNQVDTLLQGMGLQATCKKGKPHLRVAGRESLLRLTPLLAGDKGGRLGLLDAARLRPGSVRTAKPWSEGRTLSVLGVEAGPADEYVYSMEVAGTNTFATTGGVFVHNCIPIDPFYLSWLARKHGLSTRFIELAGEINTAMPAYVVARIADALNDQGKPVKGSRITLLGMAYKKDVDDPRESPGFELMDLLIEKGATVNYNDPHIPKLPPMRRYPRLRMASRELTADYLWSQDCLVVVTDHSAYDWAAVAEHARLIVDTRNALQNIITHRGRIVRA